MAKYFRRQELTEKTFTYKMFGKRFCDLSDDEKREYFKEQKRLSRQKEEIRKNEKEYRIALWQKKKQQKAKCKK